MASEEENCTSQEAQVEHQKNSKLDKRRTGEVETEAVRSKLPWSRHEALLFILQVKRAENTSTRGQSRRSGASSESIEQLEGVA